MKKNNLKKSLIKAGSSLLIAASVIGLESSIAYASCKVTAHYYRDDKTYDGYSVKMWDEIDTEGTGQISFTVNGDEAIAEYEAKDDATQVQVMIKDPDGNGPEGSPKSVDIDGKDSVDIYVTAGIEAISTDGFKDADGKDIVLSKEEETTKEEETKEEETKEEVSDTEAANVETTTVANAGSSNAQKDTDVGDDSRFEVGGGSVVLFDIVVIALVAGGTFALASRKKK